MLLPCSRRVLTTLDMSKYGRWIPDLEGLASWGVGLAVDGVESSLVGNPAGHCECNRQELEEVRDCWNQDDWRHNARPRLLLTYNVIPFF